MKAVVYREPHAVAIEEVDDPRIEEPGDVIVKVTSTAICGSDLHMYEGRTIEQKRELVAALTEAICRIAKTTPEATEIVIHDVPRHNWAQAGKLASDS